jgi:putative RNA 2'-phosphotransferase
MAKHQLKELAKIIKYIMLYRPDEFGLFLDDDGSLPVKELLWALHEEPGWGYVRPGHLKELAYSDIEIPFTVDEMQIRPKTPPNISATASVPPPLLFCAARRKAYPVILKHGLKPGSRQYLPLATSEEMALRIGKRRDSKPILLTVHAGQAREKGYQFVQYGELLYLVRELPSQFLSGPPIDEVQPAHRPSKAMQPSAGGYDAYQMPGSFLLDPSKDQDRRSREHRDLEKKDKWKREVRRERRRKKQGEFF